MVQRRSAKVKRRSTKRKGTKRKMNVFFSTMLKAKRSGAASFTYKNKTYVGSKHKHLGMVYRSK